MTARSDLEESFAFQVRAVKLPPPIREYVFAPPRRFRFDFAWPDLKVAVEIEGGIWVGGRHVQPAAFEKDAEKYSEAAILGYRVIRVTGSMVEDGRAIALTERLLATTDHQRKAGT